MKKILIVEDSKFIGKELTDKLSKELNTEIVWTKSLSETSEIFNNQQKSDFFISVLDLNLPDAPHGEVIDLVSSKGIPAIVFTGNCDKNTQKFIWSKENIVDYVIKSNRYSILYIVEMIHRIIQNQNTKVLIVDDAKMLRFSISRLLNRHNYMVVEAQDGKEALQVLSDNPDIKMVITDFEMPHMDGVKLTEKIREKYSNEEIAIVGISASDRSSSTAEFLKNGADDFIHKPFSSEEFYCRITKNIRMLENVKSIRELSIKDSMTGLYNRRFFFENGNKLHKKAKKQTHPLTIAMIDIDFFKKVNDTHGHGAGDEVIKNIAIILKDEFGKDDIVSRFGGEEFCILASNMDVLTAQKTFEKIRETVENFETHVDGKVLKNTISTGLCCSSMDSLKNCCIIENKNYGSSPDLP